MTLYLPTIDVKPRPLIPNVVQAGFTLLQIRMIYNNCFRVSLSASFSFIDLHQLSAAHGFEHLIWIRFFPPFLSHTNPVKKM